MFGTPSPAPGVAGLLLSPGVFNSTNCPAAPYNQANCPQHTSGSAADAISKISALGLATFGIGARVPTLDDVFLQLTGDRLAA